MFRRKPDPAAQARAIKAQAAAQAARGERRGRKPTGLPKLLSQVKSGATAEEKQAVLAWLAHAGYASESEAIRKLVIEPAVAYAAQAAR